MSDLLQLGQQVLGMQAFSVLLGTELTHYTQGEAILALAIKPELKQQHGFVHGGVLSYLADNALTYAGGSIYGEATLTAEFKINYIRPAKGERLLAKAQVIHAGKRQAVCRCDIFVVSGTEEKLCATAQGTIVRADFDMGE